MTTPTFRLRTLDCHACEAIKEAAAGADQASLRVFASSRGLAVVSAAAIREWMDASELVERAVFESERARAMDRLRRAREAVEEEMEGRAS